MSPHSATGDPFLETTLWLFLVLLLRLASVLAWYYWPKHPRHQHAPSSASCLTLQSVALPVSQPDAAITDTITTDPTIFLLKYSAVCVTPGSSRRWRLGGPAEVYFLNQLCWDLVQAVGESQRYNDCELS
jgi:hypothetical protein